MTTIAYKDGVIAYDSRAIQGTVIVDDDRDKRYHREGRDYFAAGSTSDHEKLIALDFGDLSIDLKQVDSLALAWDGNNLYEVGVDECECVFFRTPRELGKHYAIGSGALFALTAMDMGATAEEAVRMAAKRDTCTGGTIRTFKLE